MVAPRRALIKHRKAGVPAQFSPERFRLNDKAIDYGIEEAKRIKDWPALEEAIDAKIEETHKFVAWWGATVTPSGHGRKLGNGSVTQFSEAQAKGLTGIGKMQKHRMVLRLKDPAKYREELLGVEYLAAQLADPDHFRTNFTGQNEWHTPAKYIEMARAILGQIDLDPASSEVAQKTVRAAEYFTRQNDGLNKPWHGRVWLNPPYSPKEIAAFVAKLCHELESGHVSAAIMLTHNYTDSAWFQLAVRRVAALCFPSARIRFEDPDGIPCSPTQGQAFFYFGDNAISFAERFNAIGFVVRLA